MVGDIGNDTGNERGKNLAVMSTCRLSVQAS